MTKWKGADNELRNILQKTKDWATWALIITEGDLRHPERLAVPAPLVTHVMLPLNKTKIIWIGNKMDEKV